MTNLLDAAKEQFQSGADLSNCFRAKPADLFCQLVSVDCDQLGNIHYARFRKVGLAFFQCYISGRIRSRQVRGDEADDDRINTAEVEKIALDDDAGVTVCLRRPRGGSEIQPVQVSLADAVHQESRIVERNFLRIPANRRLSVTAGSPP